MLLLLWHWQGQPLYQLHPLHVGSKTPQGEQDRLWADSDEDVSTAVRRDLYHTNIPN